MRLDKFVSNNTDFSRSNVKKLIKLGRLAINNEPATSVDQKIVCERDIIAIDGETILSSAKVYLMLNKPQGYLCANSDPSAPTVIDLIKNMANFIAGEALNFSVSDLQIAGRLDKDTTGLVFITNDGHWNHQITSPNKNCKKVYCVELEHSLDPSSATKFSEGIQLEGEKKRTLPATLELITDTKVKLSISEGKYHQVKRMFAATGNHVSQLHRESIGGIALDPELAPGQYRLLTEEELSRLKSVNTTDVDKN